jgi:hypothetical protein
MDQEMDSGSQCYIPGSNPAQFDTTPLVFAMVAGKTWPRRPEHSPAPQKPFELLWQILPEEWLIKWNQQAGANSPNLTGSSCHSGWSDESFPWGLEPQVPRHKA